jgi:hypothetical protein
MIHREYVVQFINVGSSYFPPCDIMVEVPGLQSKPVASASAYGAGNVTPASTDWATACGANAYYELRGRPLRVPVKSGAVGFTPRFQLGYHISTVPIHRTGEDAAIITFPRVALSASLAATPGDANVIQNVPALADPTYGPIIRLSVPSGDSSAAKLYLVSLDVFEDTDEDDRRGVR